MKRVEDERADLLSFGDFPESKVLRIYGNSCLSLLFYGFQIPWMGVSQEESTPEIDIVKSTLPRVGKRALLFLSLLFK